MMKNVGSLDRMIRIVAGVAIIAWGFSAQNWLGVIGLIPLTTAALGWCPAYCPLGISTAKGGSCCGGAKSCSTGGQQADPH